MSAPTRILTVPIERPPANVQSFLAEPTNLPRWAKRVCRSIERTASGWVARTPVGRVPIRFEASEGAVDLFIAYGSGDELSVPIRVRPAGAGCEVDVKLVKPSFMPEEEFPEDVALVEDDLQTLKAILERNPRAATIWP